MYLLYKHVKKVRAAKRAEAERSAAGLPPPPPPPPVTQEDVAKQHEHKKEQRKAILWNLAILAALAFPVFLETLDYTVVATAQPHIASAFNRLDLQSYIGTAYLLTSAVFLPVFGSVADVYGRYWAMQWAVFLFLFGSALSTGAANMSTMLAGRGVAGAGAAGLLSVVRVILSDSSSLNQNNWQAACLVILYAAGFSSGPAIGGALITVSYRWVFAINLPCCALSMVLAFFLLRGRTKGPQPPRLRISPGSEELREDKTPIDKFLRMDWIGAFLFVSGGILLLLGLNWGATGIWGAAKVIVTLVLGSVLIITMFVWEYILEVKQEPYLVYKSNGEKITLQDEEGGRDGKKLSHWFEADALIPLAVMRNYDVCATQFAAFTSGMVMLVIFYFIAIFMVIVSGLSAEKAGVQLIYFAPGMGAGTGIGLTMIKITRQPKYPIVFGSMIIPVALGLISMAINSNKQSQVNGFMVMAGVGVGMTFGPLALHARFSQPEGRVAVVVSLNLFFRSIGGTVGLAQCATIMNSKVKEYFSSLSAEALGDLQNISITSLSAQNLDSLQTISNLPPAVQELVKNAFKNGVRWCFISLVPWTALSFFLVLRLRDIHVREPDEDKKHAQSGKEIEEVDEECRVEERVKEKKNKMIERVEEGAANGVP